MARKLRIQYEGAIYHVINRGNYRRDVFGTVGAAQLAGFRWSSLKRFLQSGRSAEMVCADWLRPHGWKDSPAGLRSYVAYLTDLASDEAEQKRLGLEKLSAGWAIGTLAWRRQVAKDHVQRALSPGMEAGELKELKEAHWSEVLESELREAGKTSKDVSRSIGSASWKITAARRLRQEGAGYTWITSALHMGQASSVRAYLSQATK